MIEIYKILSTIICAFILSSGFWIYVQKRDNKHNAQTEMLRGLGHDRIIRLGLEYIQRGFITTSEYENLKDYLYLPYKKLGGNGSADRVMAEVDKLEMEE